MDMFGRFGIKSLAAGLLVLIVLGGFAVALLGAGGGGNFAAANPGAYYAAGGYGMTAGQIEMAPFQGTSNNVLSTLGSSLTGVTGAVTTMSTTTMTATTTEVAHLPSTVVVGDQHSSPAPAQSNQAAAAVNGSRMVELSSNITMESPTPSPVASRIVQLAFSVGGYVAYQSTYSDSAYVVIRVPAAEYEQIITRVQGMGNVTSLVSNSNDVTVKYTNLNATLVSLEAEQQALLRLIAGTTRVNDTLAIEATLQGVNAQINAVQSEILQTQRLVTYSTISVSVSKSVEAKPLAITLSATPKSGTSPLGVTFNAVVAGGQQPYVINYNFGDGSSQQGRIVIHQFYRPGQYNVTVTATDSKGNVALASVMVKVSPAPSTVGFGNFPGSLADLLVRVLEGMATVAVVVLPPAAVLVAVLVPLRRRNRSREVKRQ